MIATAIRVFFMKLFISPINSLPGIVFRGVIQDFAEARGNYLMGKRVFKKTIKVRANQGEEKNDAHR